jgi:hypothetical protein
MSRKATGTAAMVGVVAGLVVTGWIVLLHNPPAAWLPPSPFHKVLIPAVGAATIVLVGTLVGQFVRGRRPTGGAN